MSRIYQSARDAAERAGLDDDELRAIEGTGSDGAVTRADVGAYLAGERVGEVRPRTKGTP